MALEGKDLEAARAILRIPLEHFEQRFRELWRRRHGENIKGLEGDGRKAFTAVARYTLNEHILMMRIRRGLEKLGPL